MLRNRIFRGLVLTATLSFALAASSSHAADYQGPSSGMESFVTSTVEGLDVWALLTTGDIVPNPEYDGDWRLGGIVDGMGAFDNGDDTWTLLVNHEIFGNADNPFGRVRAHGGAGSWVSELIITKPGHPDGDFVVLEGRDLSTQVMRWNNEAQSYEMDPERYKGRFCSGDLPPVTAFYNAATGLGTQSLIYMNGEEIGAEGVPFAHVVTGDQARTSYELDWLGRASWENSVASPYPQDKTIVVSMDDAGDGLLGVYVGMKTNEGLDIEKAGLANGKFYGVNVPGVGTESSSDVPAAVHGAMPFEMVDFGVVSDLDGAAIETMQDEKEVTGFARPEDGHWDPTNPNYFYWVTTGDRLSRLFRLEFQDIMQPELGGVIRVMIDEADYPTIEGRLYDYELPVIKNFDNMVVDAMGKVWITEDTGSDERLTKTFLYDPTFDTLTLVMEGKPKYFAGDRNVDGGLGIDLNGDRAVSTIYTDTFITTNEEMSGIYDLSPILGPGWGVVNIQVHINTASENSQARFGWSEEVGMELVEGGQLQVFNALPYFVDTAFPGAYDLPETQWFFSTWYGVFYTGSYPWVWSEGEGWAYVLGRDGDFTWLYTADRGFFATNEDIYPAGTSFVN